MTASLFRKSAAAFLALGMLGTAGAVPAMAQGHHDRDAYMQRWYRNHPHDQAYNDWRRGKWDNDRYRRWYRDHHNDNDNRNLGAAALFGLAAGAIAGGVIGSQQQSVPETTGSVSAVPSAGGYPAGSEGYLRYCSNKYRSFDPASGTYLGYDGQRHYCD